MICNVSLRNISAPQKSDVRDNNLNLGAISIQVRNIQVVWSVSLSGQNPDWSSRGGSSMVLYTVRMDDDGLVGAPECDQVKRLRCFSMA